MTTYREDVPDGLASWDLADPAQLLATVRDRGLLERGNVVLARVLEPATSQQLVSMAVAWNGDPPVGHAARIDRAAQTMRMLGVRRHDWDKDERLRTAIVVIVVRDGRAVFRSSDLALSEGLRYANNEFQALMGDIIVVTPHGWVVLGEDIAGTEPRCA